MSAYRLLSLGATLLAAPLSACISFSSVDKAVPFSSASDKAMVVIGVKPDYRVGGRRGKLDTAGSFSYSALGVLDFNIVPEQGYIVTLLSPTRDDERYAITQVLPGGIGGPLLIPCDGLKAVTFAAKAGQLLYLGHFEYGFQGTQLSIGHKVEVDRAREHLKAMYPRVDADLVYARPEMLTVTGLPCKTTVYLPIPVVAPR